MKKRFGTNDAACEGSEGQPLLRKSNTQAEKMPDDFLANPETFGKTFCGLSLGLH